jgi:hypothetical protein
MVQKALLLSTVAILASVLAQAGQIHVGQISGGNNLGLTTGTLNTGSATSGTGTVITTAHAALQAYDNLLFDSATENGTAVSTTAGYPTGEVSDPNNGNAAFFLIGGVGSATNTWYSSSKVNTSDVIVPINTANVATVWTMLNDVVGSNTDVTFFLNTTDSLTGATQVTVDLVDGQEIRSAVLCTSNCPAGTNTALTGGTPNYFVNGSGTASGTIGVTTGRIQFPGGTTWNPSYNGATGVFAGTSGSLTLDDQAFNLYPLLSTYGPYLVQLEIIQAGGQAGNGNFDLQAVTLGTVPEPSSLTLIMVGFGLAGFAMARRSKRSVNA